MRLVMLIMLLMALSIGYAYADYCMQEDSTAIYIHSSDGTTTVINK